MFKSLEGYPERAAKESKELNCHVTGTAGDTKVRIP